MKTVRIIETTDDKMKYKIWHDFNKAEVTEEEIEKVMDRIVKEDIKDLNVFVITFNDEEIDTVDWMIEIVKNVPLELKCITIPEYLTEYCVYGCPYYVLEKITVQPETATE